MYREISFLTVGAVLAIVSLPAQNGKSVRARLDSLEEVPTVATTATGEFQGKIGETSIDYELSYEGVQGGNALAAHIHLGRKHTAGAVLAFLCGGGGKPACPATGGTVKGTITAADIQAIGAQGVAAGDIAKAIRVMRAGATYANVHSTAFPGGELRGQINDSEKGGGNGKGNDNKGKGKGKDGE